MKSRRILQFTLLLMVGVLAFACGDKDEDPVDPCDSINATYDGDVKAIINSSCAYSGCHDGMNTGLPEDARDYTTFAGLGVNTANGKFKTRVLDVKNMPNPDITPDDKPQELTTAQLEILQCWHDAGYPQ